MEYFGWEVRGLSVCKERFKLCILWNFIRNVRGRKEQQGCLLHAAGRVSGKATAVWMLSFMYVEHFSKALFKNDEGWIARGEGMRVNATENKKRKNREAWTCYNSKGSIYMLDTNLAA